MNTYTEDQLVQTTVNKYLHSLGWETFYSHTYETFGDSGTFQRKDEKDVLLKSIFLKSIQKLNPHLPQETYIDAYKKFSDYSSSLSLEQNNKNKYEMIKQGIKVSLKNSENKLVDKVLKVIDFENLEENHYLAVREFSVKGSLYTRRADIICFINGIPVIFMELKNSCKEIQTAYNNNLTDYKQTIPVLFYYNQLIILGNGIDAKLGSVTSKFHHFQEWKRLEEDDEGKVDMETLLKGVCNKTNLLDIIENFILFDDSTEFLVKIIAKNHQYLGVNRAFHSVIRNTDKRLGVFWHTQGSGKSYSIAFLTNKLLRKHKGSYTFLICTDREDLDSQIYKTFAGLGFVNNDKDPCRANSIENLKKLLVEYKSYIFTLIQKFHEDVDPKKPYNNRSDIIVISDEAHRTQYGRLALNLRNALPNASFIGFTGTPLFKDDELTKKVFGDYVSTYNFQKAIEDGSTVPLYYDARGEKLGINISALNEKIATKIEEFMKEDQDINKILKLEKELARDYHIITAQNRLESIAIDFVEHYSTRFESGKAMFICIDKLTCVRMFNLIQHYWNEEIKRVQNIAKASDEQTELDYKRKLFWMQETRMAVVVSEEQNEEDKFQKWSLTILPHRKLMKEGFELSDGKRKDLESAFKDPDHPFRIVFVCAMWLTGFDVPSLSTLYLDKPLKAHTLMQAIARANRVYEGKNNGLIVDYCGILKNLREALATYTISIKDKLQPVDPAKPEINLIDLLEESYKIIEAFFLENQFILDNLWTLADFDLLKEIKKAQEIINKNDESRKTFEIKARQFFKLFKACINLPEVNLYRTKYDAINHLYKNLQEDRDNADIVEIIKDLHSIVDKSVKTLKANSPSAPFDISKIDFNLLKNKFDKSDSKNSTVQSLRTAVETKLNGMLSRNPSRINFQKRFEEIVNNYNNEKERATIEATFQELWTFIKDLDEEEKRTVKEGLTEESLAIYDKLIEGKLELPKKDIRKVKKVSSELLEVLQNLMKELRNWREKQNTRDQVKNTIYNFLYDEKTGLPTQSYTEQEVKEKSESIFQWFFNYVEFTKELAVRLYKDGSLSFGNARRLAEMSKLDFHNLLGEKKIPRQYDIEDFKDDLEAIKRFSL